MFYAARCGHLDILTLLLDNGAYVNTKNHSAMTATMAAAMQGHARALAALLARGACTEALDSHKRTALMYAAMVGAVECVALLLHAGVRKDAKDEVRDTLRDELWGARVHAPRCLRSYRDLTPRRHSP